MLSGKFNRHRGTATIVRAVGIKVLIIPGNTIFGLYIYSHIPEIYWEELRFTYKRLLITNIFF